MSLGISRNNANYLILVTLTFFKAGITTTIDSTSVLIDTRNRVRISEYLDSVRVRIRCTYCSEASRKADRKSLYKL